MPLIRPDAVQDKYDLVIAGTGFGSMFFLQGYLERFPKARILMVEWGEYRDHEWQLDNQLNSEFDPEQLYVRQRGEKPWYFTIGYGGGTNCWWADTFRLHPNDFRMKTKYGVGVDWPLSYDDIEPYYLQAEHIMQIAGPDDMNGHYPRSGPYPQPPHAMSSVDKVMKAAMPDRHFAVPTARLRLPVGNRGVCCDSAICHLCPTEAKFTALNTFGPLIEKPNVEVLPNSRVTAVEMEAGVAKGLRYVNGGREHVVAGELVAVGCNAIYTPFILMRSGIHHPLLGKYLHEKRILQFEVFLDGLNNFDGGTPKSGCNVSWVDGEHRREEAAAMVMFSNTFTFGVRPDFERWREVLPVWVLVEEMPKETNMVTDDGGEFPVVMHPERSDYNSRGVDKVIRDLPDLLAPLPIERIVRRNDEPTANHIQGTCRMGRDKATSVVDADMLHHDIRNLLVLGTAVWPTCGAVPPSLTAAALSLRAAERIAG
jgi:choline dehydrogenase-like flavoprotein